MVEVALQFITKKFFAEVVSDRKIMPLETGNNV